MHVVHWVRGIIQKYGAWGSVWFTTGIAILCSNLVAAVVITFTSSFRSPERYLEGLMTSTLVPLLITPVISWFVYRLVEMLDEAEKRMEKLSRTDYLTGVHNRRHLSSEIESLLADSENYPLSLMIFDANNFKQVNDTYGHLVGDQLLISFCTEVQNVIRVEDIFGRFGGDEFVLFLPLTDEIQVKAVIRRLGAALEQVKVSTLGGEIGISMSAGVVSVSEQSGSLNCLIRKADQALYQSKDKKSADEVLLVSNHQLCKCA